MTCKNVKSSKTSRNKNNYSNKLPLLHEYNL